MPDWSGVVESRCSAVRWSRVGCVNSPAVRASRPGGVQRLRSWPGLVLVLALSSHHKVRATGCTTSAVASAWRAFKLNLASDSTTMPAVIFKLMPVEPNHHEEHERTSSLSQRQHCHKHIAHYHEEVIADICGAGLLGKRPLPARTTAKREKSTSSWE